MYLGITLSRMGDVDSAFKAFEKALSLEQGDCTIYLNYATVLLNNGRKEEAKDKFMASETLFVSLQDDEKEPEMLDQRALLAQVFQIQIKDD